jgi:hypothetical protein
MQTTIIAEFFQILVTEALYFHPKITLNQPSKNSSTFIFLNIHQLKKNLFNSLSFFLYSGIQKTQTKELS